MIVTVRKSVFLFILLSILFSCKENNADDPIVDPIAVPIVETAYWLGGGTDNFQLLKGTIKSDGSQTVTKLYEGGYYDPLISLVTNPGKNEIYWVEMDFEPVTSSNFTCYLHKGDTLGKAQQKILTLSQILITAIALDPVSNKLYYCTYEEGTGSEYAYSCNLDGTGNTKLYSSFRFGDVVSISVDGASNKLYVVQNDLRGAPQKESSVYKANLDGTGTPVLLYDKTKLPVTVADVDRFTGIAVDGSNLYIASQQGEESGISYLFKGDINGGAVTRILSSSPTINDPISVIMGLGLDRKHNYLYWITRRNSIAVNAGVVYKIPVANMASATPQLVFKNINLLGGLFGPIEITN